VFIAEASASIVITASYKKTERVYGERGRERYVPMDAGHAAPNLYLQAVSLGLGTVAVGAFIDERVKSILEIEEDPLYILPVGWPRE
jgi:SagB-type dehydrogenase family enzyme